MPPPGSALQIHRSRANHARAAGGDISAPPRIDEIFRPWRRTFRRRSHVSENAAGEMTAGELLGPTHPLTRASRRFEVASLQALLGLALLAAIVLFARGPARPAELAGGIAGTVILGALAATSWCSRRRRALELILGGGENLPLDELEPARR